MDLSSPVFVLWLVIASIIGTPGPNNTLLFIAGLQLGVRKSVPLLFAINLGAVSMILTSLWITDFITHFIASAYFYLKTISVLLLLYLSYSIWSSANKQAIPFDITAPKSNQKPDAQNFIMSPIKLYFFQFINPKIWLASLSIISSFKDQLSVITIVISASIVGFLLNTLWMMFGVGVGKMPFNLTHSTISKIGAIILLLCVPYFVFN